MGTRSVHSTHYYSAPPGDVADDTGPPSTDTVCAYPRPLYLARAQREREREKHVRVCAAVGGAGGTLVCVPCFESVLCETFTLLVFCTTSMLYVCLGLYVSMWRR